MAKVDRKKMKKGLMKRTQKGHERREGNFKNFFKDGVDFKRFNPDKGDFCIDIIPYLAGKHDPLTDEGDFSYGLELFVHTRVGPAEEQVICPAENYGDPCPICEHRQRLREKGADDEVWKKLFAKRRVVYNVADSDDEGKGKNVMVWNVSHWYFEKHLLSIAKKPAKKGKKGVDAFVAFADPDEGKSIAFEIKPPKSKDDYTSYLGHKFVDRDYKISDKMLGAAHTLDELITILSYEEIEEMYWGGKPDDDENSDGGSDDNDDGLDDMDEDELHKIAKKLKIKKYKKMDEDDLIEAIREAREEQEDADSDSDDDDDDDSDDSDADDEDEDDGDDDGDDDEPDFGSMDKDDMAEFAEEHEIKVPAKTKKNKKKFKKFLEEWWEENGSSDDDGDDSDDSDDSPDFDDMDHKEMKAFVKEHDIDVPAKTKKNEKKLRKFLEEWEPEDSDDSDGDDDGDDEITEDYVNGLSEKQCKKLIKEKELDVDPDDADDVEELREMIIDDLGLDD